MSSQPEEPNSDESALIERAKSDRVAFGELYERYQPRIRKYVFYRVGSEQDAEDLTARTFMKAWEHIGRYDDRGFPFSAWLYRIAHNLVANWHRDNSRRRVIVLEDLNRWRVDEDGPEAVTVLAEDKDRLLIAIRRLPVDRQELLTLKFVDQLSNSDIGAVMGRSEGAIKSLYHRTLIALRNDIMPADGETEATQSRFQRLFGRGSD